MSGKSKIRWQKSDTEELNRAVKNFNAKITRIEKKNPELKNALPEKLSAMQMRELINTRQDLKRELNALKRFTDRENRIGITKDGEFEGITIFGDYKTKITKWQEKEINRRLVHINKRRSERLKVLENTNVMLHGVDQGYTKGDLGMGAEKAVELRKLEGLTPGMKEDAIREKYKSILKQSQSDYYTLKDFRCRENYITGLLQNFSYNDVKGIIHRIQYMPLEKFLKLYNSEEDAKFSEFYTPNDEEKRKAVKKLKSVWLPER